MCGMLIMQKKLSLIRIVFEFYPLKGGSITHSSELAEKMNPFLAKQILFAPLWRGNIIDDFPFSVIRIKLSKLCEVINFNPLTIFIYSLNVTKEMSNLIRKNHFDVVHVHGTLLGAFMKLFMTLFRIKIPLVVMAHGWYPLRARSFGVTYFIEKFMIFLFPPNYFILLDDGTEINELIKILRTNDTPYEIVHHAIDTNFYAQINNNLVKRNDFKILFPHRPIAVKKPELALSIFKKFYDLVGQKNIKLVFLAAKKSHDLQKLVNKYDLDNYVEFEDEQDKQGIKKEFDVCDVVIGTSLESNTGRAIQEAMACEKPVIVFNNGGISDLIESMKEGILVDPGDIDEFVQSILLLYRNPSLRVKLGKNARLKILEKRAWNARIETELSIYEKLIDK